MYANKIVDLVPTLLLLSSGYMHISLKQSKKLVQPIAVDKFRRHYYTVSMQKNDNEIDIWIFS